MKNHTNFNINSQVLIKLNEIGYERLVMDHNKYIGIISNWKAKTILDFKNETNENGFYRIQLYKCFELFHDLIFHGATTLPFETTILINNCDLEDESK